MSAGGRMASLDLLRFAAAMSVVVYHYTYRYADQLSPLQSVTRHGYLGVELFFVISGFVILWSARGRSATEFVRARVLRLYPEFWIAVPVSAVAFWLVSGGATVTGVRQVLVNLTMIPQYLGTPYVDGVYWTLGVEIKFYVLVWLLAVLGQLARVERWLSVWVAMLTVVTFVDAGGIMRSVLIFPYGYFFAAGGFFFLVFDSGWTHGRVAALVTCLAGGAWHAVDGMRDFMDPAHITTISRVATVATVTGMFLLFTLSLRGALDGRNLRLTTLVGSLTYPLYLLHNVGKEVLLSSDSPVPGLIAVPTAIAFSLALSYFVMRAAESAVKPALRSILDRVLRTRAASARSAD